MAAVKAVQGYVSNLRKVLGAAILLTRGRGYTIQTQLARLMWTASDRWCGRPVWTASDRWCGRPAAMAEGRRPQWHGR
jgi:hypothetical protein